MATNYSAIAIFLALVFVFVVINIYYPTYRQHHVYISDMFTVEKTLEPPSKSTLLHINGSIKRLGAAQQIYIINLARRQDRRIHSVALFQTLNLDAFIVPASHIQSPEVVSRIHLTEKGHITLVELACWASHMRIWSEIATSENDTWTFIFEDDIDLEMATLNILESFPRDLWNTPDMVYIGYCGDPLGPVIYEGIQGYRVHQAINPSCTHAYAIRSRTASKLIRLLSSPRRAIDDEIVRLVDMKKLLVFSIHPPLALQQKMTSSHWSDVNPVEHPWMHQIKVWFNSMIHWWKGVQFIDKLKDSAIARADFHKADEWKRYYETEHR